jgi:hypothetical protein
VHAFRRLSLRAKPPEDQQIIEESAPRARTSATVSKKLSKNR